MEQMDERWEYGRDQGEGRAGWPSCRRGLREREWSVWTGSGDQGRELRELAIRGRGKQ
jgi:hypothetical protein